MVDDEIAVASSVHGKPEAYAILVGSGVSREAGVKSGREVIQDLVRQVARAQMEDPDNPLRWYEDTYGTEPRYDELLEQLARSAADRRALLESYFEPTDEEREAGIKTPSSAHRSIASLVDSGYVNVIVTTNFDRLIEQALEDRDITPTVIDTPARAGTTEPLVHQDTVVIKPNGDYKQTSLKNTPSELSQYAPPMEELISEVFTNYGLIISGWSGEWDTRLRELLIEHAGNQFTVFWTHRGELGDTPESIVEKTDASPVETEGADEFFSRLQRQVRALEEDVAEKGEAIGPVEEDDGQVDEEEESTSQKVKRLLSEEKYQIELADFFREEAQRVRRELLDEERFPLDADIQEETVKERIEAYEELVRPLPQAVALAAYWSSKTVNSGQDQIVGTLSHIADLGVPEGPYRRPWEYLRFYPASLLLYASGVAALEAGDWNLLKRCTTNVEARIEDTPGIPASVSLHPSGVGHRLVVKELGTTSTRIVTERIRDRVRDPLGEVLPSERAFTNTFDRFDGVLALLHAHEWEQQTGKFIVPEGTYRRYRESPAEPFVIDELASEIGAEGGDWPGVQAGLFNGDIERLTTVLDECRDDMRAGLL